MFTTSGTLLPKNIYTTLSISNCHMCTTPLKLPSMFSPAQLTPQLTLEQLVSRPLGLHQILTTPPNFLSLDLWHFCNGDLYGHNFAERWQNQLANLRHQVDKHFDAFDLNPHIIWASDWFLFTRTLSTQGHDIDAITCWLSSFDIAHQSQATFELQCQCTSNHFFASFHLPPCDLPPTII